jgi:hypothetical protein
MAVQIPTEQDILNKVFVTATKRLAVHSDTGDNLAKIDNTSQKIWNLVFDPDNNIINLSMS